MGISSTLGSGTEGQPRWSLRLFESFELTDLRDGEKPASLGKRERVLLAYLALSPKGGSPRRKLAALLWDDASNETLLDNLRATLFKLRRALGDAEHRVIVSDGEDIVFDAAAFDVDALAFARLATQSGRSELEAAAKLYTGELLDGLNIESEDFESWRREEAARFKDQAIDVLDRLMAQRYEHGAIEQAIEAGKRILRLEPLHEPATRRLMWLYTESGRRPTAIQLYRTLSDTLKADLGIQPESETRAVFAEITRDGGGQMPADAKPLPSSTHASRPSDAPTEQLRRSVSGIARAHTGARHFASLKLTTPKLGWMAASGIAAAAAVILGFVLFASSNRQTTGAEAAKEATSAPAREIALAVIPFVNLSNDADQQFFSDGLTEELTSGLSKVAGLKIVARTSAFAFKGKNIDVKTMAEQLGATHLIEGTVRKAGDRVRITAQLVKADDGIHVWAEDYDRQLTDIFAIQEDIARAITASLRVPLGLKSDENLVKNRSIDLETYQVYLRATALLQARGATNLADAVRLLEQVVERTPTYAPAWALLAETYFVRAGIPDNIDSVEDLRHWAKESLDNTEAAGSRAMALDPNLAAAYDAAGLVAWARGKPLEADQLFRRGLALDPDNSSLLFSHAIRLSIAGHLKEGLEFAQKAYAVEPLNFQLAASLVSFLWVNGQTDAAIAQAKSLRPTDRAPLLAVIYASLGRYREAADALTEIASESTTARDAMRLLRTAPAGAVSAQSLPKLTGILDSIYLHVGAPERAMDNYERRVQAGVIAGTRLAHFWHPSYAALRRTERFKTLVRASGLIDYWRAKGWPEVCRPVGYDDFVCD